MGGVQVGVAFQWDSPQRGTPKSMMTHILQKTKTQNDVALFLLVVKWLSKSVKGHIPQSNSIKKSTKDSQE